MKTAMKLTTSILAIAIITVPGGAFAGRAWAQNPDAIDAARSAAKALQQQANPSTPSSSKPVPGAPAPAIKPAVIPSAKPAAAPVPVAKKAAAEPKPVSASASGAQNKLQKVNVIPQANGIQIEISSSQPITPRLSTLKSPDRVLVELPDTTIASSQSKVPVGKDGIKGVRIGMDGKTPPTTSVVVDLEKPLQYELTPGSAGKLVLTLHADGSAPAVAKNVQAAPLKAATPAAAAKAAVPAPAVKAAPTATAVKAAAPAVQTAAAGKNAAPATKVVAVKAPAAKPEASKPDQKQQAKAMPATKAVPVAKVAAPVAVPVKPVKAEAGTAKPKPEEKKEEKKWAMSGKRDPFFSPVVQQSGSGCSTGKKCLEIGAINLRGVVKSDSGFIAVVTNSLNKAYFLRENDPVFNGYVVKITGDSVVFQETIQDKLGKSFTREVVKRIFTPAV